MSGKHWTRHWFAATVALAAGLLIASDAMQHYHAHGLSDALSTAGTDVVIALIVLWVLGMLT